MGFFLVLPCFCIEKVRRFFPFLSGIYWACVCLHEVGVVAVDAVSCLGTWEPLSTRRWFVIRVGDIYGCLCLMNLFVLKLVFCTKIKKKLLVIRMEVLINENYVTKFSQARKSIS